MPNIDSPPPIDNIQPKLLSETAADDISPFLQKFIESGPTRHEVEYMKQIYSYEDFHYAAYHACETPWRKDRFMLQYFSEARWQMAKDVATHLLIGFVILIPLLF